MLEYKLGDKIRIIHMEGEPHYEGRTGTITLIDSMGQLHGTWGGLAINPNYGDKIELLEEPHTPTPEEQEDLFREA